jgi:hypothetical protein
VRDVFHRAPDYGWSVFGSFPNDPYVGRRVDHVGARSGRFPTTPTWDDALITLERCSGRFLTALRIELMYYFYHRVGVRDFNSEGYSCRKVTRSGEPRPR